MIILVFDARWNPYQWWIHDEDNLLIASGDGTQPKSRFLTGEAAYIALIDGLSWLTRHWRVEELILQGSNEDMLQTVIGNRTCEAPLQALRNEAFGFLAQLDCTWSVDDVTEEWIDHVAEFSPELSCQLQSLE